MDAGVIFVVHVWHDARGFHATARDVTREGSDAFDDPVALALFLGTRACSPPIAGPPGPADGQA